MLRLAEEHRFPVTPRASGTNLSGGAVPLHGGVVLSCARMRRLIEIDEQNLTATCEPGPAERPAAGGRRGEGPVLPARSGLAGDLDDRRQRDGVLGRPARAQVRHHARLRDRPGGRADGRPLPARGRQADQGRRRLRPRPAAGRLRGDARGAHRDHAQAAAGARGQGDRRRLLPRPRGLGSLGQPHHREPHPARHARVPRPGDDARRRRERGPRAARRRGGDADLRAGRRRPGRRARHRQDGRDLPRGGRAQRGGGGRRGRGGQAAGRTPRRDSRARAARADADPRGRHGAALRARRRWCATCSASRRRRAC